MNLGIFNRAVKNTDVPFQPMSTAPRDGTVIELELDRGPNIKPWRKLYRWVGEAPFGEISGWQYVDNPTSGIAYESWFHWRPWIGDPQEHFDPLADFDSFDYYMGKRPKGYKPTCASRRHPDGV